MMKKWKNRLDEMQEHKLLQIESRGYWLAFWGLFIAIIVQLFYGRDFKNIAGEWIVFMCLAVYMVAACMKNGIWSRIYLPTNKTNMIYSIVAGIFCGIFRFVTTYFEYHTFWGSVAVGIGAFVLVFGLCYGGLSYAAFLYKRKVNRLENEEEEETEIEGKQDNSGQSGEDIYQK